jgi:hypothetical protein
MPYQYVREPLTAEESDRLSNACETPAERPGLEKALADVRPVIRSWFGSSTGSGGASHRDGHRPEQSRGGLQEIHRHDDLGRREARLPWLRGHGRVHIIRERTLAGLAATRAQGGRNLDDKQQRHAVTLHGDPTNDGP